MREDILAKIYQVDSSHETLSSISYDSDNRVRGAVWGDDSTLWVLDIAMTARYMPTTDQPGARTATRTSRWLTARTWMQRGMWSDGTTMWVTDKANQYVYAYSLVDNQSSNFGERAKTHEFGLAVANADPRAIWGDGSTLWVLDSRRDAAVRIQGNRSAQRGPVGTFAGSHRFGCRLGPNRWLPRRASAVDPCDFGL